MTAWIRRLVVLLSCAIVLGMYWTNDDMAGQPDAPRGNGQYLPILDRGDGHMLYLMARSTALDLDWNFDNDLKNFGDPWGQPLGPNGHKQIPHPIGPPLIWTPLIWVAQLGAVVANALGADIPLHGYTPWHQRFVFLSSALAGIAAVLLGRRAARAVVGGAWAPTYAAIAVLLGTSLAYYTTYMPSYGHALDALACAAFLAVWIATLGRCDLRRWLALGALLGVAMLIRMQDLAFGVVIAIEAVWRIVDLLRRRAIDWRMHAVLWLGGGVVVLAVALVVFVPQLAYWKIIYGKWLAFPQGRMYTRLGSPMMLELLYAPRNGWLSTTPIAYLAVIGLACLPKRSRLVAVGLGAAVVVQVYLNSTILDWWGMSSFGARRMCSVTLPLVVGLAALLWRVGQLRGPRVAKHALAIAVLGSMVAWNLWRVGDLKAGKPAPLELLPTCCDHVPEKLRPVLSWFYDRIGDPFEFPANAWFAWRHDVEIQRWDKAVGYYALMPSASSLVDDTWWLAQGGWRIGYPLAEPYLLGPWSDSAKGEGDKDLRWTLGPGTRVIVPNLMPYAQRFTLWLAPGGSRDVVVRWDGHIVGQAALHAGWNTVTFDVTDMPVGEHELGIAATPAPFDGGAAWPAPHVPVGVAVNLVEDDFIPP